MGLRAGLSFPGGFSDHHTCLCLLLNVSAELCAVLLVLWGWCLLLWNTSAFQSRAFYTMQRTSCLHRSGVVAGADRHQQDPLISPSVPLAKKLSPSQPEPRRTPTTATGLFAQSQPAPSSICTQKHTLGFSDFSLASQHSPAHKKCLELRWFLFYRGERLSHLSCTLGFPPIPDLSASSLILKELTRLYSEGKLQGSNKPTIL